VVGSYFLQVYEVVALIPAGRVVSYAQIALHLGAPGAARTVGWAMKSCPGDLPWHRVVNARGRISAPQNSERFILQCDRLRAEGIVVDVAGNIDMRCYGWPGI
jgi:methylated-DNA-protein-cysteine methyltransferase related protein